MIIFSSLISLLLSLLFLFSFRLSQDSSFGQLLNDLLLVDFCLEHELLPLFIQLSLPDFSCLLLHPCVLLRTLLLQVQFFKFFILVSHEFTLFPLFQSLSIVHFLVSSQVVLDQSGVLQRKVVHSEIKINESGVVLQFIFEQLPTLLVKLIVSHVQRKEGLVLV